VVPSADPRCAPPAATLGVELCPSLSLKTRPIPNCYAARFAHHGMRRRLATTGLIPTQANVNPVLAAPTRQSNGKIGNEGASNSVSATVLECSAGEVGREARLPMLLRLALLIGFWLVATWSVAKIHPRPDSAGPAKSCGSSPMPCRLGRKKRRSGGIGRSRGHSAKGLVRSMVSRHQAELPEASPGLLALMKEI
jgi:hypothetical protein